MGWREERAQASLQGPPQSCPLDTPGHPEPSQDRVRPRPARGQGGQR